MVSSWMPFLSLCLVLLFAVSVHGLASVDPFVLQDFERVSALDSSSSQASTVSYLLYLKQQADLAALEFTPSTAEVRHRQGVQILQLLKETSTTHQQSVLEVLKAQGDKVMRIHPYFIANAILVESKADLDLLDILKSHPDIEFIESNRPFVVPVMPEVQQKLVQQDWKEVEGAPITFQSSEQKEDAVSSLQDQSTIDKEPDHIEWNIEWVHAPQVWNGTGRGEGMIYANADTGVVWQHETLYSNYLGVKQPVQDGKEEIVSHDYAWWDGVRRLLGRNEGPCGVQSREPCDDNGHGTHTTSTTVGGMGVGVAPGAKWMACRNMDQGLGSTETYLNCLEFFLAPTDLEGKNPKPELRPHAIGNSYGCPRSEGCAVHSFSRAVKALRTAGIFMSVSAGNDGPGCSSINSPPAYEELVITVGSTSRNSPMISFFSSRGPALHRGVKDPLRKPDVTAPGSLVRAAYPAGRFTPPSHKYRNYNTLSGTSMASPHVGGAALLIMQACPCMKRDIDQVQEVLQQTADHYTTGNSETKSKSCGRDSDTAIPNNVYGYGGINIERAIKQCKLQC